MKAVHAPLQYMDILHQDSLCNLNLNIFCRNRVFRKNVLDAVKKFFPVGIKMPSGEIC